MRTSVKDRLLESSEPEPNSGCLLCLKANVRIGSPKSRTVSSKLAAYMEFVGAIPAGKQITQSCGVDCCINPAHLRAITVREKMANTVGIRRLWCQDSTRRELWLHNLRNSRRHGPAAKTANREPLSLGQIGLVYGTLLGDSSIALQHRKMQTPILYATHGIKQIEWARYKSSRLKQLEISVTEAPNAGYGTTSVRFRSHTHTDLIAIHALVRPAGQPKTVSRKWLDAITEEDIAWWYMDDGSLSYVGSSAQVNFHTEGFTHEGQLIIQEWLRDLGFESFLRRSNRGHEWIALHAAESRRWIARFRHFCIPSMAYKFRDCEQDGKTRQGRLRIRDIKQHHGRKKKTTPTPKIQVGIYTAPAQGGLF